MTRASPPGAPIDEDLIGRELQMGRTPVREAIKRLALENLVTVFPRRGTFASDINITDLAHISDVRSQLEGHAAYRAAERITDAQRAELSGMLEELQASRGTDDLESLMELDARVHRFIYRCSPTRSSRRRRALLQPVATDLVPGDRPAAAPVRAGARTPGVLLAIAAGQAATGRDTVAAHVATFEQEIRSVL